MTDEYNRGLQDGFKWAVKASRQNRDHFRELLKNLIPHETHEDVMDRIYKRVDSKKLDGVHDTIQSVADGVDLYVMLPDVTGNIVFPHEQLKTSNNSGNDNG